MKHDQKEPLAIETLKAAADQGRDEYWKRADGQGTLPERVKGDSVPLTDYERLLNGLYEAARVSSRGANDTYIDFVGVYAAFLEHTHPDAAHQIREGIRDAGKSDLFYCPGCGVGEGDLHSNHCPERPRVIDAFPPRKEDTTKGEFSEEEIAAVKRISSDWKTPFAEVAVTLRGIAEGLSGDHLLNRLATCAEHLAKQEG